MIDEWRDLLVWMAMRWTGIAAKVGLVCFSALADTMMHAGMESHWKEEFEWQLWEEG